MTSTPDLFIAFGPRALWSLAGIVTLVLGVWHVDRTWDEDGSRAYEKAKATTKDKSNFVIPAELQTLTQPLSFRGPSLLDGASMLLPTFSHSTAVPILKSVPLVLLLLLPPWPSL